MLRALLREVGLWPAARRLYSQSCVYRSFSSGSFESRVVWLFGSPRSGSTWLLGLLGEHEAVVPINEPLIGWYLGPFLSDLPGVNPLEMDVETFTLRRLQGGKSAQFFAEEFKDVWLPGLARLMLDRFRAHVVKYPAEAPPSRSLVMLKEPNGSQSADVIMRALPRSRFLFLLRDGRDVVDSELAASQRGSWVTEEGAGFTGISDPERLDFVVQSAHKWLWRTQIVQEAFRKHGGPKHIIRYEDLLRDPISHVRTIFDWLGLPISPRRLSELVERHAFERLPNNARGRSKFYRAATPGLWRENMTLEEQAALERILGSKLRELGYEA